LYSLIEGVFSKSVDDGSFTGVHLTKEDNFILDIAHFGALLWVHFD